MPDSRMWTMDKFRLDGKVAVITGASRNIGASIASGFAQAGADVILIARRTDRLVQVADIIRERNPGRRVEPISGDVGRAQDIERIIETTLDRFGQVDVLVNNAYARAERAPTIFDHPDEAWTEPINVNVMAPYRLCRGFGPGMINGAGGSIINVLTGSAFQPNAGMAIYGSTKAALWMLTRYLALECAPKIRVNALAPGLVSETGEAISDTHRRLVATAPMQRVGHPDEMVGAAVYLASDAASYTTGEIVFCNGGRPY
jgi:NAD(P)-dependent dehydrogenase (short-subunit alcohol dehydrogenase family)